MIKSFLIFAFGATSLLLNSCATTPNALTKAAGDAVVDSATKDSDPLTKAVIRQQTGYGTDPVEEAKQGFFQSLGL